VEEEEEEEEEGEEEEGEEEGGEPHGDRKVKIVTLPPSLPRPRPRLLLRWG